MSLKEELERQSQRLKQAQFEFFAARKEHAQGEADTDSSNLKSRQGVVKPPTKFYGGGEIRASHVRADHHGAEESQLNPDPTEMVFIETRTGKVLARIKGGLYVPVQEFVTETSSAAPSAQPPINAEYILHFLLQKHEQDALIGDLIEGYGRKVERFGKRRADIWFCYEVGLTAWPLVRRFVARLVKLAVIGEWIRRVIH